MQVSAAQELLKKTLFFDICITLFSDEKVLEETILKFPQNDQMCAFGAAENKHCETLWKNAFAVSQSPMMLVYQSASQN